MRNLLFFLLLTSTFYACTQCGPQAEPTAQLSIFGDSLELDSVYAIGAVSNSFAETIFEANLSSWMGNLPLSLHADSSSFVFKFRTRTDTLTIFYKREFYYKPECSFVVDIKEPKSPVYSTSTFRYVQVDYQPYIYTQKAFSYTPNGIAISVTP